MSEEHLTSSSSSSSQDPSDSPVPEEKVYVVMVPFDGDDEPWVEELEDVEELCDKLTGFQTRLDSCGGGNMYMFVGRRLDIRHTHTVDVVGWSDDEVLGRVSSPE